MDEFEKMQIQSALKS